jgi:hypothetical protein
MAAAKPAVVPPVERNYARVRAQSSARKLPAGIHQEALKAATLSLNKLNAKLGPTPLARPQPNLAGASPADPTRPSTPAPSFGTRPTAHISSSGNGLLGLTTNDADVFGSPTATVLAHRAWPGKSLELENWTQREGYGSSPAYLKRSATLPPVASAASLIGYDFTASRSSSRQGARMRASASVPTIRLTEHPLLWRQLSSAKSNRSIRSTTSLDANNGRGATPLCCTYGLHPAFHTRGMASAAAALAGRGPRFQVR